MTSVRFIQISGSKGPLSGHIFYDANAVTDAEVNTVLNLPKGFTWADVASESLIITRTVEAPADGQI
jgi:hypothetical protein